MTASRLHSTGVVELLPHLRTSGYMAQKNMLAIENVEEDDIMQFSTLFGGLEEPMDDLKSGSGEQSAECTHTEETVEPDQPQGED